MISFKGRKVDAVVAAKYLDKALSCMDSQFGKNSTPEYYRIKPLMLNTKERILAYDRFNAAMDGSVMTLPEGDNCVP